MTTRPAMSNLPNEPPHPIRGVRGISRRTESGPAPLSFGQQRLWFLNQLRPNDSAYNMIQVLRLTGPLDVPALERAFNEIRRRHDVLRANFDLVGDQPVQFVAPYRPVPFTVVDCSNCPEDQRESACQEAIDNYSRPPFNLKNDPLLRTALVRLGPTEHRLALVMHHIIYDGWSTRLMLQECATLYEAFAQGKPSPLPELPIQYSDYARWQREWLTGPVLDKQLSYWKERLRGSVSPLELPADRPRRGGETSTAAHVAKVLPVELLQSLKSLGQRHNATLFMTLLAAFQTLLYRVSGQDDIVLGSPNRRTHTARDREAAWVLRQYAPDSDRYVGQANVRGIAGPRSLGRPGCDQAPGVAVREARRGAAARTKLEPLAIGSSHAQRLPARHPSAPCPGTDVRKPECCRPTSPSLT